MIQINYILPENGKIPEGYKPYSFKILSPGKDSEEVKRTLRMVRAHGIQGGQDIIFRRCQEDYEVYMK
jgi:hypothetical protein